jgi:hypothetical protein
LSVLAGSTSLPLLDSAVARLLSGSGAWQNDLNNQDERVNFVPLCSLRSFQEFPLRFEGSR